MELRELRSFCTAAKVGGISKAASELDLGQPTVTTHIRKLEEEIGAKLFDRSRRPIRVTPSGAALLELAAPLVEGIDDLVESTTQVEQESLITVATTNDMVAHTLLRTVTVFLHRHPHTRLRVRAAYMDEIVDMVRSGEMDLGLIPYPGRSEEFDFAGLFAYERVLIAPLGHPLLNEDVVSFEQIAEWPLILRGGMTLTRSMLESEFKRRGLSYEVLVELDGMDIIKRYVALGMGISVGPRLAIEPEDERALGIVNLANLLPIEQAGILTLRGRTLSTPAEMFIQVMRDTLLRRR
ncbi:MAG: LysR substrate-binding domain-containing protein [Chloroflexi bacterium]|nr:LysR substrate-binding domain-containing protein [Chloroflexota bacterium]